MSTDALRHRLRSRTYIETDDGKTVIIDDPMAGLHACHTFMLKVLAGAYDVNVLTMNRQQRDAYHTRLRRLLPCVRGYYDVYVPGMIYHPTIQFFLDQYRRHAIAQLLPTEQPGIVMGNGATVAEVFQDFVQTLKFEAGAQRLRKRMADHDAKLAKNQKRLREFEKELFRRCSRPVIARVDFGFKSALFSAQDLKELANRDAIEDFDRHKIYASGGELDGRALPAVRVSFEEVQRYRAKLFENMKGKPSLFKHLVGYVWRIEYGRKSGFHLHVLLAFDGAHVRQHEWLTQNIGEYWVKEITQGRGRFHNCNADWDKDSARYGLGAIAWHDDRLRGNLADGVLPYLAKFDQYVLARPYKNCKLMGSGFMHRHKPSPRGRKRSLPRNQAQPPGI